MTSDVLNALLIQAAYQGATAVNQGALFVNGTTNSASSFTVNRGAVLGGIGVIAGSVTVNNLGLLTPGDIGGGAGPDLSGAGILSTGSLTLAGGSTLIAQVNGTTAGAVLGGYDQINVTGAITIASGAMLNTTGTVTSPTGGRLLTLLVNDLNDPIAPSPGAQFFGIAEGALLTINGVNFTVSYVGGTGNDFVIYEIGAVTTDGTSAADQYELRRLGSGTPGDLIQLLQNGTVVDSRALTTLSASIAASSLRASWQSPSGWTSTWAESAGKPLPTVQTWRS